MTIVPRAEERLREAPVSQTRALWWRFRTQRLGMAASLLLMLILLLVVIVPMLSPFTIYDANPAQTYAPFGTVDSQTGQVHWLGTDFVGKDFMVRLFQAGRIPIVVSLMGTLLVVLIGTALGLVSGYYGGWLDTLLMRFTDFMLAIPLLPIYLLTLRILHELPQLQPWWKSADINPPLTLAVIVSIFALFGWMGLARLVHGSVLSLRSLSFIEAARALGVSNRRIMLRHLLPNSIAPIIVAVTFTVGDFIILEAVLAYFSQGIGEPPFPTWGNMLPFVQGYALTYTNLNPFENVRIYLFLLPSFMIFITVACINYIGEALRTALDPHGST